MEITFVEPGVPGTGAYVVGVLSDRSLTPAAAALNATLGGALERAAASGRFSGKKGETLSVVAPSGTTLSRVLLVGLGAAEKLDAQAAQGVGAKIVAALNAAGDTDAAVAIDLPEGNADGAGLGPAELAAELAFGAHLRSYRFDRYRTKEPEDRKPTLSRIGFRVADPAAAMAAWAPRQAVAESVDFARDLISEPGNVIYPETLAAKAQELAALGVDVEVLDAAAMEKLGMGALLGVSQGSIREPRLVVMRWAGDPDAADQSPVAFVGKGVTFDTGGISIKPSQGMEQMKWDMAGAGAVIGAMRALAARHARVNAIGVCAMVENMPSGTAQRPGDVVTSMSGQTIEVINTDAEGRLILADAVWYTQDRFKPRFMVDLATLTGAMIVALGHEHAGLFASDDTLAERLLAAGKASGELLWRMPVGEVYDKQINSDIADMKNVGAGRSAGSIAGAVFIQRFANGVPWAHLDIAGVAWAEKDLGVIAKGATAFGVRLLDRLVADHYESR